MEIIKMERTYNAPVERVWKAITDREQMKQWYFTFGDDWQLKAGQQFDWYGGDPKGKQWLHRGKMLEIIENKKLVHTWEYPGYPGLSKITWELSAVDANTTRLNFVHEFSVPFDPENPVFAKENFVMGWDHIVNTALTGYLQK